LNQLEHRKMDTLFPLKGEFRWVKLRESDAISRTDDLKIFGDLVLRNEPMYPGIAQWLKDKVIPGLAKQERVAYLGYEGETPIVSAVVKLGKCAKFCHLWIHEDFRDQDLGQIFFSQMASEIRPFAKEVHFTLPESLWETKKEFFASFGFICAKKSSRQYRRGDTELCCSAKFESVWSTVLGKLPSLVGKFNISGFTLNTGIVLSIRPEFASKIFDSSKTVEIRTRFSKKWTGQKISLYASNPCRSLVGEATVDCVREGHPDAIWNEFEAEIGCTKEQFDDYAGHREKVYAVQLKEVVPYIDAIPVEQISRMLGEELAPPQSYLALEGNKTWASAISLAALMHGAFRRRNSVKQAVNDMLPTTRRTEIPA
jgi:predicted transcriptional regulator